MTDILVADSLSRHDTIRRGLFRAPAVRPKRRALDGRHVACHHAEQIG